MSTTELRDDDEPTYTYSVTVHGIVTVTTSADAPELAEILAENMADYLAHARGDAVQEIERLSGEWALSGTPMPEITPLWIRGPATDCPMCAQSAACPCCGWLPGEAALAGWKCPGCGFVDGKTPMTPENIVLGEIEFELVRPLRESGVNVDTRACLLAQVDILGASHHLEAIAVHYDNNVEEWRADDPDYQEKVDQYMLAAGDPGDFFETVRISGREYILGMTPYCR